MRAADRAASRPRAAPSRRTGAAVVGSPMSKMARMLGCDSAAIGLGFALEARASRSASSAKRAGSTLIATSRSSRYRAHGRPRPCRPPRAGRGSRRRPSLVPTNIPREFSRESSAVTIPGRYAAGIGGGAHETRTVNFSSAQLKLISTVESEGMTAIVRIPGACLRRRLGPRHPIPLPPPNELHDVGSHAPKPAAAPPG